MYVSARHKALDECLDRHGILESLAPYKPQLIGTIPLGIDRPDSDIDIACETQNLADFEKYVSTYLHSYDDFSCKYKVIRGQETVLCRFCCEKFEWEIFAQNVPVEKQYGVRHFNIEKRLLALKGDYFKNKIKRLREGGMKTEPAFAALLSLKGDPYEALIALEDYDDQKLRDMPLAAV